MSAARPLDMYVMMHARQVDVIHLSAAIDDDDALHSALDRWLEGGAWDPGLWPEIRAEVTYAEETVVRRTVTP